MKQLEKGYEIIAYGTLMILTVATEILSIIYKNCAARLDHLPERSPVILIHNIFLMTLSTGTHIIQKLLRYEIKISP